MVGDFWQLNQRGMAPEKIKALAKEFYAEDFIENYQVWKECIKEINDYVIVMLGQCNIPDTYYEPITFDEFCSQVISALESLVDEHGNLVDSDIPVLLKGLGNRLFYKNRDIYLAKRDSVESLVAAIKKIVVAPIAPER